MRLQIDKNETSKNLKVYNYSFPSILNFEIAKNLLKKLLFSRELVILV